MANATQKQKDNRTLNIENLTDYLWKQVRSKNKNMLVLEPGHEFGTNFMNVRVYFTKDWNGPEEPKQIDETVVFEDGNFELSMLSLVLLVSQLGYEHDALMCSTLNDLESPFVLENGFDTLLLPRIVDFSQTDPKEHAMTLASLMTAIKVLSDPSYDSSNFDLKTFLQRPTVGEV